jgi:hypothetical protein
MKLYVNGISLEGTRAEWRRLADALVLSNPAISQSIEDDCQGSAYSDPDTYDFPLDNKVVRIPFNLRHSVEAIFKALNALSIDVEEPDREGDTI